MHFFRMLFYKITNANMFRKVEDDFRYQLPQLKRLLLGLRNIMRMKEADGLDKLVFFFKILSPWDERTELRNIVQTMKKIGMTSIKVPNGYAITIHHLETLLRCIEYGGRNKFGMNRACADEEVSDATVYVGGHHGIDINSVRKWKMIQFVDKHSFKIAQKMANQHADDYTDLVVSILNLVVQHRPTPANEISLDDYRHLAQLR